MYYVVHYVRPDNPRTNSEDGCENNNCSMISVVWEGTSESVRPSATHPPSHSVDSSFVHNQFARRSHKDDALYGTKCELSGWAGSVHNFLEAKSYTPRAKLS